MKSFRFFLISMLIPSVLLTGCATSGGSTLLGSGIGALLGAGVGALVDPGPKGRGRIRNVFVGAAVGGLFGAGAGYVANEAREKKQKEELEKTKNTSQSSSAEYGGVPGQPVLIPPRVEVKFIDDQVRGNIFIPGHFEFQIADPARWR